MLFVVGVEYEEDVQGAFENIVRLILLLRRLEHHVQEVAAIREIVVRVRIGQPYTVAIGESGDGRNFGDETVNLFLAAIGIENIFGFRVEGRERADSALEHSHRVRVVVKAFHEFFYPPASEARHVR